MRAVDEFLNSISADIKYKSVLDDGVLDYVELRLDKFRDRYPGNYEITYTISENNTTLNFFLKFNDEKTKTWYEIAWS